MGMNEQERAVQGIKDPGKRKAAYYRLQRENAEETGDESTVNKISSKGYKAKTGGDPEKVNKGILGGVAALAGGGPELAGAKALKAGATKLFPKAAKAAEGVVEGIASKAKGAVEGIGKKLFPKGADGIKNPKLRAAIKAQKESPRDVVGEKHVAETTQPKSMPHTESVKGKAPKTTKTGRYQGEKRGTGMLQESKPSVRIKGTRKASSSSSAPAAKAPKKPMVKAKADTPLYKMEKPKKSGVMKEAASSSKKKPQIPSEIEKRAGKQKIGNPNYKKPKNQPTKKGIKQGPRSTSSRKKAA
jgi:hypothetical protein